MSDEDMNALSRMIDLGFQGVHRRLDDQGKVLTSMHSDIDLIRSSQQELGTAHELLGSEVGRHKEVLSQLVKRVNGVSEATGAFMVRTTTTWKTVLIIGGALATAVGIALAVARLYFG